MSSECADIPPLYHPPGMWVWDFWFAKQGPTYHAFHLQAPSCLGDARLKGKKEHVGHATSTDLVRWTNCGPAVVPLRGTWNDVCIATGSVAAHDGKWWMVFTGRGSKRSGIGLAVSDDLMSWRKVGDGPVAPLGQPFEGTWKGRNLRWIGLADPYVYPEPIDGWFYMVINSKVVGDPENTSGCLTTMRSRDMLEWEPHAVIAYPGLFDRLETPQLWSHRGRWYLYFGGAQDHGLPADFKARVPKQVQGFTRRGNFVFVSDRFAGPFEPKGRWWLSLPDGKGGYIAKVLPGPDGRDVLLITQGLKLSRPYPVTYEAEGSIALGMPSPEQP